MPYTATIYNVMIASPGDVAAERNIIRDLVNEWNAIHSRDRGVALLPMGWETHSSPLLGDRPQEIINNQLLKHADLLIAVFWTRLGTPTGEAVSGTVEEIEEHIKAGKPAMIYFSSAPVRPDSVDEEQYAALREFKNELKDRGLYETYDTIGEFRDKLARQLAQTVIEHFTNENDGGKTPEIGTRRTHVTISDEATELLIEASKDPNGNVLVLHSSSGFAVQTNGRNLVTERSPRVEAKWDGAVKELVRYGLLQSRGHKGQVFTVTASGYDAADQLTPATNAE